MSEAPDTPAPETSPPRPDKVPRQEHVVEWTRNGALERVVCRGACAEERAREWKTSMKADPEVSGVEVAQRFEDQNLQFPAAVHVGGPTVTLRLGAKYQDLTRDRGAGYESTFFEGANAHERATEFAARAKERAY